MLRWMGSARHLVVLVSVLVLNLSAGIHRENVRAAGELTLSSSAPAQDLVLITTQVDGVESLVPKWTKPRYVAAVTARSVGRLTEPARYGSHRIQSHSVHSAAPPWVGTVPLRI